MSTEPTNNFTTVYLTKNRLNQAGVHRISDGRILLSITNEDNAVCTVRVSVNGALQLAEALAKEAEEMKLWPVIKD